MPEPPTRAIEQRLRAAAEARRKAAGGPFTLHPVDRQALQAEVARTLRPPERRRTPGFQRWLRANFFQFAAAGTAMLLGLFVLAGLVLPGMAKAKMKSRPRPVAAGQPADSKPAEVNTAPEAAPQPTAPVPTATTPPSGLQTAGATAPAREVAAAPSPRRSTPEPSGMAVQPSPLAPPALARPAGDAYRQATAAQVSDAAMTSARLQIGEPLSQFRVDQRGPEVRLIDEDGSVYRGMVVEAPATQSSPPAAATRPVAGGTDPSGASRTRAAQPPAARAYGGKAGTTGFAFAVAGTNQTSQQAVQLRGNLLLPAVNNQRTQLWIRSLSPAQQALGGQTAQQTAPSRASDTNAVMVGELQVGPAPAVPFEARPAGR